MEVEIIAMLSLMFSPIYGGILYLINRERKNSRQIQGIIHILDDEFEDINVEEEIPGTEGV